MNLEQFKKRVAEANDTLNKKLKNAESAVAYVDELNLDLQDSDYRFTVNIYDERGTEIRFENRKTGRWSPLLYTTEYKKNITFDDLKTFATNLAWWKDEIYFARWLDSRYYVSNDYYTYVCDDDGIVIDKTLYTADPDQLFRRTFASLDEFLATATNVIDMPVKLPITNAEFVLSFIPGERLVRLGVTLPWQLIPFKLPKMWENRHKDRKPEMAEEMLEQFTKVSDLEKKNEKDWVFDAYQILAQKPKKVLK